MGRLQKEEGFRSCHFLAQDRAWEDLASRCRTFESKNGVCFWQQKGLVEYPEAVRVMEAYTSYRRCYEGGQDIFWLLEHPPLYTAGRAARKEGLLERRFNVFSTDRGGQYTYHGPGQRVVYGLVDLAGRAKDVHRYIRFLEAWCLAVLEQIGLQGYTDPSRVGIWVQCGASGEKKIAAIGIHIRHWLTSHGFALNVSPDLSHFSGIIPCGLADFGITSLKDLGFDLTLEEVDELLLQTFPAIFRSFYPPLS